MPLQRKRIRFDVLHELHKYGDTWMYTKTVNQDTGTVHDGHTPYIPTPPPLRGHVHWMNRSTTSRHTRQ